MPTIETDFIPPPIPGTKFAQTGVNSGMFTGPIDALSAAGCNVPGVIPRIVKVPTHVPMYPFQKDGVQVVVNTLLTYGGAMLADDMGLGKTRQAAVVASIIKQPNESVLIVCPAGVRHQWLAEVARVSPNLPFQNLGPQSKKEYTAEWDGWAKPTAQYAAVSYNLMGKALEVRKPTLIILDEPHNYLQSRGSAYNKSLWKHLALIRYRLALTGTPYLAKPAGLWSILFILLGMKFGKARDFDIRYCDGHQGQWGWENKGSTHSDELAHRLQFYMMRRMKSEVLKDMPAVTRSSRWVEGTSKAASAMAMMDHSINGMMKAQESTLLDKMEEVVDVVGNSSGPTVVFTWLKEHADMLTDMLNKKKFYALSIHGDFEAGQRAKMVAHAASKKLHVVTTYGASATGLDGLQHFSSNIVFHAINPVPAITLQAIDRLNRIGQKEPITATFVAMKNSVDELLVDKVINRLEVFSSIMGRDKTVSLTKALENHGLTEEAMMNEIFASLT